MKFFNRNYMLVVLLQMWLSIHVTLSSSISGDLLPPIPRWQESWTASQAHGTAMAMVVQDCVVMFMRSPASNVYKPQITSTETITFNGLEVAKIDAQLSPSMQYAPSWFPIGSHTVCAMTGLALDVEHLSRVLQKKVDDHWFVYQKSVTTHAMTQKLASVLQNECLGKGGRPYGVQCLLAGCDDINGGLCLYSMDPTGSWQSWGTATAIGKFATETRKTLAKKLSSSRIVEIDEAINCLITSWKESCKEMGIDKTEDEDCEVLILRKDPNNSRKSSLFRVSNEHFDRIMNKVEGTIATAD